MKTVTAISSKSYVHRLLIAGSLCDRKTDIVSNIDSDDMKATRRALDSLMNAGTGTAVLDCGESGSTARFLLPLAALLAKEATLTGSGKLPERPMGPLCEVLRAAGVSVSSDHLPITVSGSPHAGDYEIEGNVSSQFISGLLFMLPLLDGTSTLTVKGKLESAPYVDMTVDVLERFGIRINKRGNNFEIPGGQKYVCDSARIVAEGDWSNAAYVMTLASLGSGRVFDCLRMDGLDPDSIQGDRAVIGILEEFGIEVKPEYDDGGAFSAYIIKGGPRVPVDVDCTQIPDLVPALAVLAAFADGDSVFRNVGRLRMKECDRIEAVTAMLGQLSVVVDITSEHGSENMTVHGSSRLKDHTGSGSGEAGIVIDSFNDHRIAMAASAIAFATDRDVTIKDAMAVNKSYPGFYDLVRELGLSAGSEGDGICHLHWEKM